MPGKRPDYYTALGVLRDATPEEIKRAYYAAARRFHPDQNMLPGETELFLVVQQAYEILSNSERRSRYDATLPAAEDLPPEPIQITMDYSRPSLVQLEEPQLIYALLEAKPSNPKAAETLTPLNLCLVLDRSTSMKGEKMDMAKSTAVRIIQMLRPVDLFGLVVFSDRAEVMLPSAYQNDLNRARSRIQSIQTGGATEIFQGLHAGLEEVRRSLDPSRGNHLILVTDGHTYGDEQACLKLAEEAAQLSISISGFGIGGDWNDIFLDSICSRTGGNSNYVSDPQDIQRLLLEKFAALARSLVDDAVLEYKAQPGVQIRSCHRLQPEGGPVEIAEPLHLGPILHDESLNVLFEFVIESSASSQETVTLLDGTLHPVVAARPTPFPPIRLRLDRPSADTPSQEPPPQPIVSALSRLSLYRLQERARNETAAGEYASATRHLRNLALQLQAQGQHDLSKTTLFEAETIERLQASTEQGMKQVKYGTRALMRPEPGGAA
jgi:Ca-activated chloride channel family protein